MIRIFTDSTCDLSAEQADALGVTVIPLTVYFGEDAYLDGVDITPAQFYEKLAACGDSLPTTSQINPVRFVELFSEALEQGDDVVAILLSSELSGTYQSAVLAKEMLDRDRVHVVDSRLVTVPLGLLVSEAAHLRDTGLSAAELAEQVTALSKRVRLLAVLDTLKYLKLGGRISAATAAVGGVLGITPLVSLKDGLVVSVGKCRGRKAGLKWIREQLEQVPADLSLGVAFGHSGCPEAMEACMEAFPDLRDGAPRVLCGVIGSVVGTHIGPGATGIVYFTKE